MLDREDSQTPETEERNYQLFNSLKANAKKLPWKAKGLELVHLQRDHLKFDGSVKIYETKFEGNTILAEQILGQTDSYQVVILPHGKADPIALPTENFTRAISFPPNSLVKEGRVTPNEIKEIFEAAEAASSKL